MSLRTGTLPAAIRRACGCVTRRTATPCSRSSRRRLRTRPLRFPFGFPTLRERIADAFRKETFARLLPETLRHCGESVETAGEKLAIEPRFWQKIVRGRLYPEKNTILALALVCRMQWQDVLNLLAVSGFTFREDEGARRRGALSSSRTAFTTRRCATTVLRNTASRIFPSAVRERRDAPIGAGRGGKRLTTRV